MQLIKKKCTIKFQFFFLLIIPAFILGGAPKILINELRSNSLEASDLAAVCEKLKQEILEIEYYTVVERSDMEALMAEQMLRESELAEQNDYPQLRPVSADLMLSGSVEKIGKKTFLTNLKIIEVSTGVIKKAISDEFKGSLKKYLARGLKKAVKKLEIRAEEGQKNTATKE